jgi:uncharacterized membrane protein
MLLNANLHLLNIAIHVFAGTLGILIGLYMLVTDKGSRRHRVGGRVFVGFASVVCLSAIIGSVFFRFIPLFAVLSLLVPYVLLSGWHVIYTQAAGPDRLDAILLVVGIAAAAGLVPVLASAGNAPGSSAPVVFSTLGALGFVLLYDTARWVFPKRWHATTWRFEHIYKILSALFGMMSAAVGNIFHTTWAQLVPSGVGIAVVLWFMWRELRGQRLAARSHATTPSLVR